MQHARNGCRPPLDFEFHRSVRPVAHVPDDTQVTRVGGRVISKSDTLNLAARQHSFTNHSTILLPLVDYPQAQPQGQRVVGVVEVDAEQVVHSAQPVAQRVLMHREQSSRAG